MNKNQGSFNYNVRLTLSMSRENLLLATLKRYRIG